MLHVWRDHQCLSGVDRYLFIAVENEFQCAFKNIGDLFVVMAVFGNDTALAQQQAGQHRLLTVHKLALQQGIEVLHRDG